MGPGDPAGLPAVGVRHHQARDGHAGNGKAPPQHAPGGEEGGRGEQRGHYRGRPSSCPATRRGAAARRSWVRWRRRGRVATRRGGKPPRPSASRRRAAGPGSGGGRWPAWLPGRAGRAAAPVAGGPRAQAAARGGSRPSAPCISAPPPAHPPLPVRVPHQHVHAASSSSRTCARFCGRSGRAQTSVATTTGRWWTTSSGRTVGRWASVSSQSTRTRRSARPGPAPASMARSAGRTRFPRRGGPLLQDAAAPRRRCRSPGSVERSPSPSCSVRRSRRPALCPRHRRSPGRAGAAPGIRPPSQGGAQTWSRLRTAWTTQACSARQTAAWAVVKYCMFHRPSSRIFSGRPPWMLTARRRGSSTAQASRGAPAAAKTAASHPAAHGNPSRGPRPSAPCPTIPWSGFRLA